MQLNNSIHHFTYNIFNLDSSHDIKTKQDQSTPKSSHYSKKFDVSNMIELETIDLSNSSVEEISGLETLKSLKSLELPDCKSLKILNVSGVTALGA